MSMAFMEEDVGRLGRILRDLLRQSGAEGGVVCDSGGYVLAKEGPSSQDPLLVSALGAGVFGASRELARLLGEDEFSAVFHQGEKRSIFIRSVNSEVLLVVIFSMSASIGLVRLYSGPAAASIRKVIDEVEQRGQRVTHPEQQFVLSDKGALFGANPDSDV
ncbi:MAG: roadblock/LC7 domain-containing protein [Kiritimatiellae bacterium]|nr:roadblock/LC7 domain-containing protein [Kiritimatiellia bacterium]